MKKYQEYNLIVILIFNLGACFNVSALECNRDFEKNDELSKLSSNKNCSVLARQKVR